MVTGATGATGGAVVARLVAAGAVVLGVARKPPAEPPNDATAFVAADLTTAEGPRSWAAGWPNASAARM